MFTGPGVDFVPVKHRPYDESHPPPGDAPAEGLDDDLVAVLERAPMWAAWHGHPWIGVEHVLLAILELQRGAVAGIDGLDTDLDRFDRAVAEFYEGPYADARVAIVAERRAAGWRPRRAKDEVEPTFNYAVIGNLQAISAQAVAEGRLATPADFVRFELAEDKDGGIVTMLLTAPPPTR